MNIANEVITLRRMTVGQLQDRYVEVFGEAVRSRHKQYLVRRIAWRLQANAECGLSERALRRAEELADDADVRVTPPREGREVRGGPAIRVPLVITPLSKQMSNTDPRLPPPGTQMTRDYKGQRLVVNILPDGFEHNGERYKSLSALAKAITGAHVNGFRFFGLEAKT
ncbi:MAG: DUF2924 domain-containing protein [Planctomycetes bacterium]|nr:DUF2924 domain-containing protein [Planctomycetota bacterium]